MAASPYHPHIIVIVIKQTMNWPDESRIIRARPKQLTLVKIQNLFYNTGLIVCVMYVFVAMIIQPSLQAAYNQRIEFSVSALLKARKLVTFLEKRIKTTPITVLGFNEVVNLETNKRYLERSTQTDEPAEVYKNCEKSSEGNEKGWSRIAERLKTVNEALQDFNNQNDRAEYLDSFSFQVKLVHDQLSNIDGRSKINAVMKEFTQTTREMKGWFINRRIPS